jgi:hypothetical protein
MELAGMPATAEHFDAKATVLVENVSHHIEEEGAGLVPEGPGGSRPQTVAGDRRLARGGQA